MRCIYVCRVIRLQEGYRNLVRDDRGMSSGDASEDGEKLSQMMFRSLEFSLWTALSSLVLCPMKSSCLGLLNSGRWPGSPWVALPAQQPENYSGITVLC